ncbi:osteopetrosis-associated transmembrane protein 1 isoform X2 [Onychostruthus taczanowskii]|uniref:osteopetrosis-associated transmembrane protein 1 isoform X2 n=1 Tax=Onychostruthus taczanowskii TaxID=356909 RepID=UPI001B8081B9|nr:osteopetrosis-associated transmembrane protein 1 isoform X2 [Onychostruthus taczanowskii]
MAPPWCGCRAALPALALALLGFAAAAGPRQTPALELAQELAEELWSAGLPGDLPELEPECRSLLAAFAEGSAALTGCLGRRARPVRLCQGCHGHYRRLLAQYGSIARAVGNSSESHNCAKSILTSDRLQIVVTLSEFFNETWEAANCANCLKNNSEGLSNSTEEFLDLFNKSLTCFEHNFQGQGIDLSPNNYTEVCRNCNETYTKLNDLYNHLQSMNRQGGESAHSAHLCIDVEDAVFACFWGEICSSAIF